MIQQWSIGLFAGGIHGPLDALVRPVIAALALAVVIGLLATILSLAPSLATIGQRFAVGVAPQGTERDRGSRANDDGYLEGLIRALDHDI